MQLSDRFRSLGARARNFALPQRAACSAVGKAALVWLAALACCGIAARNVSAEPSAATATTPSFAGPIAKLLIYKSMHVLIAVDKAETLVAAYRVSIGPGGAGFKQREGDMTTPVGTYHVVLHATTVFDQFLLLDYPNAADRKRFADLKRSGHLPSDATIGGNVGIHGTGGLVGGYSMKDSDWTAGCIALDNEEIRELARGVRDGTVVEIYE